MARKSLWLAVVALAALATFAHAQEEPYPVRVSARPSVEKVKPGDAFEIVVKYEMDAHWHIYGPMENEGTPTTVAGESAVGFKFGEAVFPKPEEIEIFGSKLKVYEKSIEVRVPVQVDAGAKAGPAKLKLKTTYAACDDKSCLPPLDDQPIEVTVQVEAGAAPPAGNGSPAEVLTLEILEQIRDNTALTTQRLERVEHHAEETTQRLEFVGQQLERLPGVKPDPDPATLPVGGPGEGGAKAAGESEKESASAAEKPAEFADEVASKGLLWALAIGYFGGLVSTFTPCVYPMIPITLSYFGSQAGGSKAKTFMLAVFYVLGIVITFTLVGLLVAGAGKSVGALSANPWVVGVLVAVFLAMALSMFGLFEITLPSSFTTRLESAGSERGGAFGATILGLVLGFVAAPCVGPFAGSLISYAATQPPHIAVACLAIYGLGMGTPFLFLGVFTGALPKPGAWMDSFKKGCGFVILGMAVYFMIPLSPKHVPEWFLYLSAGAIGMTFATFLGGFTPLDKDAGMGRVVLKAAGVLTALFAACSFIAGVNQVMPFLPAASGPVESAQPATAAQSTTAGKIAWIRNFEEGMALAAKLGRPVFLDFTAHW